MTIDDVPIKNGLAWALIKNPPVNAMSTALRQRLLYAVKKVQGARVTIQYCAKLIIDACVDISKLDAAPQEPRPPDVIDAIEFSEIPFVAAMHGTVLGGGLKSAISWARRIAKPGAKTDLPKIDVGLIHVAGGTQRACRMFGEDAEAGE